MLTFTSYIQWRVKTPLFSLLMHSKSRKLHYISCVSNNSMSSSYFSPSSFCLQRQDSSCTQEGEIGHISLDRLRNLSVHNDHV